MPSPQHHENEQPNARSNKYEHFILENENERRKNYTTQLGRGSKLIISTFTHK